MDLLNDNNNHPENMHGSDSENNNIVRYGAVKKDNSTNIVCCQNGYPGPTVQAELNCENELGVLTKYDESVVNRTTYNMKLNEGEGEKVINRNQIHIPIVHNANFKKTSQGNQDLCLDEAIKESDLLEASKAHNDSYNELVYDGKYGNVLIMEFLGKAKEIVSLDPRLDIFEDLMDDLFSVWHSNDKFKEVVDPEPGVPLRCLESLPSIYKTKNRGGPKMVAFHILKPEFMPELLKVNKLSVSKEWEFEDTQREIMVRYTPEDEFPVVCRLPDPVVRKIDDLPIEIWGDIVNEERTGIVKFNNTQNMKETQLMMVSEYTAANHKPHHYFLGICYECSAFPSGGIELSRCGGCQLVAYCGRDCQKKNWKKHKYICKTLPVKKGKNVFTRGSSGIRKQESWNKLIFELDDKARKAWDSGNSSNINCCSSEDKNSCSNSCDSSSNVNNNNSSDNTDNCVEKIICNNSNDSSSSNSSSSCCNNSISNGNNISCNDSGISSSSSSCESIANGSNNTSCNNIGNDSSSSNCNNYNNISSTGTSSKDECCHGSSILDDSNCYPEELIYWGRYCSICYETRMEKLFDCTCGCVSYCSNEHRNMDMEHFEFCHTLYMSTRVYRFYKLFPGNVYLPYYKKVQKVFKPLTTMLDFLTMCRAQIEQEEWLDVKFSLMSERLSYPLTVIYALQNIGVGPEKKSIGEITELNLHILSHYAMLDASIWEMVLHYLPALKKLNVSYIGEQHIARRMANDLNITCTNLRRCKDCEEKDRIISIALYPMHYHMFFSSDHYSDPDAIGVFQMAGIIETNEEDEDVHATTSFRNLTYDKHVPLILTDIEKDQLNTAKKKINEARPVKVIIPAKDNPFAGYRSTRRHKCGYGHHVINDAQYFACLIQK